MIGCIINDDMAVVGHSLFNNFRLALQNHLEQKLIEVRSVGDLCNIDTLIIVDEHFAPNVNIWKNDTFIRELNDRNIRVIVFNFEKIFDSKFPWNTDHQHKLCEIKNLFQLVSDVSDAERLGKSLINKQLLSRDTQLTYNTSKKTDRILFIGQCDKIYNPSYAYSRRYQLLQQLKGISSLPLDVVITERRLTYSEFLAKLASYKYILNPLGTGDFLNLRFYEALELGCIPIQQITDKMLPWYSELSENICAHFTSVDDIENAIECKTKHGKYNYYLEDYFMHINLKSLF